MSINCQQRLTFSYLFVSSWEIQLGKGLTISKGTKRLFWRWKRKCLWENDWTDCDLEIATNTNATITLLQLGLSTLLYLLVAIHLDPIDFHPIDFSGSDKFIWLISQLQNSIQMVRLTITARYLHAPMYRLCMSSFSFVASSFILVVASVFILVGITPHYPFTLLYTLSPGEQFSDTHYTWLF